jgi:hypothetical protein
MIKFGSVFRHRENYYVYLGQTDDIIYAARILDNSQTKQLQNLTALRAKNQQNRTHESTVYCFAILSTDEFKSRAAYLHSTENDTDISIEPYCDLCAEDIEALKNLINEDVAIPSKLKEIVRQTFE